MHPRSIPTPRNGYCEVTDRASALAAVRIKKFGVELSLAQGGNARVDMQLYKDQRAVLFGRMKRDRLPCRLTLTEAMRAVLNMEPRKQGQRTPRRLQLNWFDRSPDRFYSLSVPSGGIALPEDGTGSGLAIELHIAATAPLLPWPVLFYFQAAAPVPKRWGGLRWVMYPWLPICPYGLRHFEQEVSPSGRVIDLRLCF